MLIDYSKVKQIYIVCGKTDMRKSIDGLASIIQDHYNMDVFGNGVIQWPRTKEEVRKITQQELRWLLEGLKIDQPKAIKKVKPGHFN